MLFENEILNITGLKKVIYYSPKPRAKYNGNLPTYELMLYVQGQSRVHFNGKTYDMGPNQLLYLPKGVQNARYSIDVVEEVCLYNVYFDTDLPLPAQPMRLTAKTGELQLLFERLYRTWAAKGESYYYKSVRYTYKIFELLRRQQLAHGQGRGAAQLLPCGEYLSAHYCDRKFNYAALTACSGLSYSYFKKLFIQKYGVSPVRQVNRMRIARACELLESGRFTVGQIAELCGFENTYYFSTVFKNHMGVSPKNYTK